MKPYSPNLIVSKNKEDYSNKKSFENMLNLLNDNTISPIQPSQTQQNDVNYSSNDTDTIQNQIDHAIEDK